MSKSAVAKTVTEAKALPVKSGKSKAVYPVVDNTKDYFVEKDGLKFAGTHLILELWDAGRLDDPKFIADTLESAARIAGATVLHTHMHQFSPNGGVSGVVVLAESHISIHTWPERGYAALDIFMCGECDPYRSVPILRQAFRSGSVQLTEHKRGLIP